MFRYLYVPQPLCSPFSLCSPVSVSSSPCITLFLYFAGYIFFEIPCSLCPTFCAFPGFYVPNSLCSNLSIFLIFLFLYSKVGSHPHIPGVYVPQSFVPQPFIHESICSPVHMFPGLNVLFSLCSLVSVFSGLYVPWSNQRV